jgi:hypothetical protein
MRYLNADVPFRALRNARLKRNLRCKHETKSADLKRNVLLSDLPPLLNCHITGGDIICYFNVLGF